MTTTLHTVYRCQPIGLNLGNHRSETSDGTLDCGVHVFWTLAELYGATHDWSPQEWRPEVVAIECDDLDVADNGDYEGMVLIDNRGKIVGRTAYESWDEFIGFVRRHLGYA